MRQSTAVENLVIEYSLTGDLVRPRVHSTHELLDVARRCLLLHGPTVSTALIAHQAGVSQATLFKRFGTKENLVEKALKNDLSFEWVDQLEAGPKDGESVRTQLATLATRLITFYLDTLHPVLTWRASKQWPSAGAIEQEHAQRPIPTRTKAALTTWLLRAQENGDLGAFDADSMAIFFIAGCQAPAFRTYMSGEDIALDQYLDTFIRGVWSGIAP